MALPAPDQAAVTGHLTSADHEADEGYFALGPHTVVIAKPGSELHRWLLRHRGRQLTLTIAATPDSD